MNALVINCSPVRTGATAEIVNIVSEKLSQKYLTKNVCIDDYQFAFCRGCRSCHTTAKCVLNDGVDLLMNEFERADMIVSVAPSYWADIPGQFKAFIDRCTPWCNTHEPHAAISAGKKGYAIALRTGPSMRECDKIIGSIEHFYGHLEIEFYGHLEIECCEHLCLCSVEFKEAVKDREREILTFCDQI